MRFLEGVGATRPGRPRRAGRTQVVDKFQGNEPATLEPLAAHADVVKIRWGLPLVVDRAFLRRRVRAYHELGLEVSTGGTLTELAVRAGRFEALLDAAGAAEFDVVELSEGSFSVGPARLGRMLRQVRQAGMEPVVKIGRKDARLQPSPEELARLAGQALDLGSPCVAIEAGDGFGVGVYREDGSPNWATVDMLLARIAAPQLLFEAPLERQQAQLLLHLGQDVNLGAVEVGQLASLECMRLGMGVGATFGASTRPKAVRGSPALKFVYHLVRTEPLVDQTRLMERSGLPRRTVQLALESLVQQGAVAAAPDLADTRRKVYRAL